eukprot:5265524-Pyramimonas_sp.AAC.1
MKARQLVMGSCQVMSDCKGSVGCCHRLEAASGPGNPRAHLWRRMKMNDDFCRAPVLHVKAHASMSDVREGVISQFDRAGNMGADELAKAGASFHRASE